MELEMKKGIDSQYLFYYSDDNTLRGRTYDRCENFLSVTFQAAPRKAGQVRVTLCPLVRTTRGEFQISVRNEEREYEFVRPERLYDLNLTCDVPVNGFLVVAPSNLAKWSASLGNAFLIDDDRLKDLNRSTVRDRGHDFRGERRPGPQVEPVASAVEVDRHAAGRALVEEDVGVDGVSPSAPAA